eukprot:m.192505 g.192505  ORF g.192505 m.192505 type:complete len:293 (+) comp24952_c0_seq2:333-1211(+)
MYHPTVDLWGPATVRRFLVLRGCVGIGGLSCFYYAIAHMPLSDATVVMFTSPVWTCLFAWALLGEKMGLREAVSIAISIVGICFIAKPTFLFPRSASATDPNSGGDSSTTFALAIGVLGSVFAACAYVVIRFVGTDVHFITQVHAFAVAGMLVSPVAILVFEGESLLANSTAWGWMVLCGVAGFLAQCFMSRGLQLEKVFCRHPLPPYQDRLLNRVDFLSACGGTITPLHLIRRELTSCAHFAGRPGKSHAKRRRPLCVCVPGNVYRRERHHGAVARWSRVHYRERRHHHTF